MTVRKSSPLPLYHQVVQEIRRQIRSGELEVGARLPSERELAEHFGISRMTLRQALSRLVHDGWLTVRHGAGTFVAEPKLAFDALHLMGFTESVLRQNGTVTSTVLEHRVDPAPARVVAGLGLRPSEAVVRLVRLRHVDGEAVALESSFVPHRLCPGLEDQDLANQSLYRLLEDRYGLPLHRADQAISATTTTSYEAETLGIAEGIGLLLVEGVSYADDGVPAEYFEVLYRGDRFKLTATSDRHDPDGMERASGLSVVMSRTDRDPPHTLRSQPRPPRPRPNSEEPPS